MTTAALELEDAQARLLGLARLMPETEEAVEDALDRYCARDVVAARTQPAADLSAMDGYAIAGDGPWSLVGESRAGAPFSTALAAGECVRISTGAHMPEGAERVLIQENASVSDQVIGLASEMPAVGAHVRRTGMDFRAGETLVEAGTRLKPPHIGLALSGGNVTVNVRKAPRIAVLDSGDELSADPAQCEPHQIPASNGAMLAAMLRPMGCEVLRIGPVADDMLALKNALNTASECDLLITSGGASVGDHDLLRPALEAWGADIAFWKVAMKPGKPLMVATRGEQVILGLPGNPVSSFVTCFLFALPLVRAMVGASNVMPKRVSLPMAVDLPEGGTRRELLRGQWDGTAVTPVRLQDSSAMAALASANCLIERPARSDPLPAGSQTPCYLLQVGGGL